MAAAYTVVFLVTSLVLSRLVAETGAVFVHT